MKRPDLEELLQAREAEQTPAWLVVIDDLSQGDRTRWDFFFEMSVIEGLNAYSFSLARKKDLQISLENPKAKSPEEYLSRAFTHFLFTR